MSEKFLSEREWKTFAVKRGYKNGAALAKALVALEKAETAPPAEQLNALDEVEKQSGALRREMKGDKELATYLGDVDKALEKTRKTTQQAADQAARLATKAVKAGPADTGDDEEESPALLTTKMIPLLREVRKGVTLHVLVALAGKDAVVMLSRKPIGSSRRKLLTTELGATGGVKFVPGECLFELGAYTFVVLAQAGGLAKKVKAALLKQTEQRYKVRVRGEDPNDIDDDGEPAEIDTEDDQDQDQDQGAARAAPRPEPVPVAPPLTGAVPAAPTTTNTAAAATAEADAAGPQFNARLMALLPQVKVAIGAAGPAALDLKLKVSEAGVFARKKEFDRAHALLDEVAVLLGAAGAAVPAAPALTATPANPEQAVPANEINAAGAAFNARLTALLPRVKTAIVAAGPSALDIKLKVSEAGVFARKKEFEPANALLDEVQTLLATAAPAASAAVAPDAAALRAEYDTLRARIEPAYLSATTAPGMAPDLADQAAALRRAWDLAGETADGGGYERALLIMKRLADGGALDKLVQARKAAVGGAAKKAGPGLVEQRKFMLERWQRIPTELNVELQSLSRIITDEAADDAPAELVSAIDEHLRALLEEIQDGLDAGINAGDMSAFKGLRARVESDDLVAHLLTAPFMDGSKFKRAVLSAMTEIEAGLVAA